MLGLTLFVTYIVVPKLLVQTLQSIEFLSQNKAQLLMSLTAEVISQYCIASVIWDVRPLFAKYGKLKKINISESYHIVN